MSYIELDLEHGDKILVKKEKIYAITPFKTEGKIWLTTVLVANNNGPVVVNMPYDDLKKLLTEQH